MNTYRLRKRAFTEDAGVARIEDDQDCYHFYVRMRGGLDRSNLRKAIDKAAEELGMVPSNPMLLGYLLRRYVGENV
jgi:hypothetical protein